jgi:hypothetical protein
MSIYWRYKYTVSKQDTIEMSNKKNNKKQTNKLRGLSPQANYTDRANAAWRRS